MKPLETHSTKSDIACALVCAGTAKASAIAATMPTSDCQKYFSFAGMPLGSRCTTLR